MTNEMIDFTPDPGEFEIAGAETMDTSDPVYNDFIRRIKQPVELPALTLDVPAREGFAITFDPAFSNEQLQRWLDRATNRRTKKFDGAAWACNVISNCAREIVMDGKVMRDRQGEPITFATATFQDMLGAIGIEGTIREFYGVDGHMMQVARRIVTEAGYGDDIPLEDDDSPTK